MKTITAFVTNDGQVFERLETAQVHEVFLQNQDVIENFLDSELNPYKAKIQRAIARQSIVCWETWKTKYAK